MKKPAFGASTFEDAGLNPQSTEPKKRRSGRGGEGGTSATPAAGALRRVRNGAVTVSALGIEYAEKRQREHEARIAGLGERNLYELDSPMLQIHVGDCRKVLPVLPEFKSRSVDLVFADPPFNWNRGYDKWNDSMDREDYLTFTENWLDVCIEALNPAGAIWVNIPDDTAAEIVLHLKKRGLHMVNWCIWHYRFGQNRTDSFINSKVHVLYFAKGLKRTWNAKEVLEMSDRAAIYNDVRTQTKKDGMPPGMRVPMDVWYGPYMGRIQGNNAERRANHDNQLPEAYLERVIRASSNEGDLVVDPFTGSGTTAVMAHALKRRFIGSEFSVDNAKSAFARVQAGPVRLNAAKGASTAIFGKRGTKAPRHEGTR